MLRSMITPKLVEEVFFDCFTSLAFWHGWGSGVAVPCEGFLMDTGSIARRPDDLFPGS